MIFWWSVHVTIRTSNTRIFIFVGCVTMISKPSQNKVNGLLILLLAGSVKLEQKNWKMRCVEKTCQAYYQFTVPRLLWIFRNISVSMSFGIKHLLCAQTQREKKPAIVRCLVHSICIYIIYIYLIVIYWYCNLNLCGVLFILCLL